ncbi:MAG: beta-ketoacyl-[acyl-carrier-protein] synthase family protein [Nitrospirae bacterium]|nr:beta-ketoacyl-[acyl-carrier-protein] synthase family protein [Nitrospirota bacterium]
MKKNRVVITGIAAITSAGNNAEALWKACVDGKSGISPITLFDTTSYPSKLGGIVKDFSPEKFIDPMKIRRMDKVSQLAAVSAMQAIKDSGLQVTAENSPRIGIVIGSGYGGTAPTEEFYVGLLKNGPNATNPMLFPITVPNTAASQISFELKVKGPNSTFMQKEASAEAAICYAARLIMDNRADAVVAGGVDELNAILFHAYCALNSPSPRDGNEEIFSPFDKRRNGLIVGEGAGILLLERLDHALNRGARIYGEIAGWGMTGGSCDIADYDEKPDSMIEAVRLAMKSSDITVGDIDYINASANGTKLDALETMAMKEVFGKKAKEVPVSSTKPITGDFKGMGAVRLITSLLAIRDNIIPPTINYSVPDPECDLDYVPNTARKAKVNTVLLNSFSNGGSNISLLVKRYK